MFSVFIDNTEDFLSSLNILPETEILHFHFVFSPCPYFFQCAIFISFFLSNVICSCFWLINVIFLYEDDIWFFSYSDDWKEEPPMSSRLVSLEKNGQNNLCSFATREQISCVAFTTLAR